MSEPTRVLTIPTARKAATIGAGMAVVLAVGTALVYPAPLTFVMSVVVLLFGLYLFLLPRRPCASLTGTVFTMRGMFSTTAVDLAVADHVELTGTGVGIAVLRFRQERRQTGLGLLAKTEYLDSGVPADELLLLAAALGDRPETATAVPLLRQQAAHLQAGGDLASSPLAALTGRHISGLGKAGAAGAATDL